MAEPLSSNQMPAWVPRPEDGTAAERWLWKEIERLTAELEIQKQAQNAITNELYREIDRLKALSPKRDTDETDARRAARALTEDREDIETDAWHCPYCGEPHTRGVCPYPYRKD